MSRRLLIANCSPVPIPNWRWISSHLEPGRCEWRFFSALPKNRLERLVRRPNLARIRACRETARCVARETIDLLVTHSPLVTGWSESFARRHRSNRRSGRGRIPHLAFAFNFTQLPHGLRRGMMRKAFSTVDRFVVFSQFERTLYSEHFDIPPEKIDMIPWGVQEPPSENGDAPLVTGDYCCAVGSQARDYATLMEAMRRLPETRLVLVARPDNLRGLSIPANVSVRTNVPLRDVFNIVRHSRFLVLPLLHSEVPCGHVTIVTAMYLGKAVLATESIGISDYVHPDETGLFAPSGDSVALAERIRSLWDDAELSARLGEAGRKFAREHCTEQTTVDYMQRLLDRLDSTGEI